MKREKRQHILEAHYLDMYNRAVAILDDEDDAKDAVQEAIVKTLVRLGVKDPLTYCMRATVNESINILRYKKRRIKLNEMVMLSGFSEEHIVRVVNEAKEGLEPVERIVLEFHREDGYTLSRLAGILGVSTSTVKRLLTSAEKKMKKTIKDNL